MTIALNRDDDLWVMRCDGVRRHGGHRHDCDTEYLEPRRAGAGDDADDARKARRRIQAFHGAETRRRGGAVFDLCAACADRERRARVRRKAAAAYAAYRKRRAEAARQEGAFMKESAR